ncbi:MAG: outer membrane protein [Thermodesulfobacteriota bacterium]
MSGIIPAGGGGGGGGGAGTLDSDSGMAAGAKFGHWFTGRGAPYLGVEVDLNAHFPDLTHISGAGWQAQDLDAAMTVYSGTLSALVRYPDGNIRPYIGGGMGVFHANVDAGVGSVKGPFAGDEDTRFGLQLLAGLYLSIVPRASIFAEYRYVFVNFEFDEPGALGLDVDYRRAQLYGGLSINF